MRLLNIWQKSNRGCRLVVSSCVREILWIVIVQSETFPILLVSVKENCPPLPKKSLSPKGKQRKLAAVPAETQEDQDCF